MTDCELSLSPLNISIQAHMKVYTEPYLNSKSFVQLINLISRQIVKFMLNVSRKLNKIQWWICYKNGLEELRSAYVMISFVDYGTANIHHPWLATRKTVRNKQRLFNLQMDIRLSLKLTKWNSSLRLIDFQKWRAYFTHCIITTSTDLISAWRRTFHNVVCFCVYLICVLHAFCSLVKNICTKVGHRDWITCFCSIYHKY